MLLNDVFVIAIIILVFVGPSIMITMIVILQ